MDKGVLESDAKAFSDAASEPKQLIWNNSGHEIVASGSYQRPNGVPQRAAQNALGRSIFQQQLVFRRGLNRSHRIEGEQWSRRLAATKYKVTVTEPFSFVKFANCAYEGFA